MTGVPGSGGPVPKRSSQRRRSNSPDTVTAETAGATGSPEADPSWHPVAVRWFESLADSGQSTFYEPSDWATAWVVAESISRELSPQPVIDKDGNVTMVSFPPKGASLAAWLKAMTSLMVTEGDRRRARLELERTSTVGEVAGGVSELDEYRRRFAGDSSG